MNNFPCLSAALSQVPVVIFALHYDGAHAAPLFAALSSLELACREGGTKVVLDACVSTVDRVLNECVDADDALALRNAAKVQALSSARRS